MEGLVRFSNTRPSTRVSCGLGESEGYWKTGVGPGRLVLLAVVE